MFVSACSLAVRAVQAAARWPWAARLRWDDRENLRSDSKEWIEVWARLSGEAAPEEYDRKLGDTQMAVLKNLIDQLRTSGWLK